VNRNDDPTIETGSIIFVRGFGIVLLAIITIIVTAV
jgi:hypothetical protein